MTLDLDVNTDLWPLETNDRFTFALASTLSLDGSPDAGAAARPRGAPRACRAHTSLPRPSAGTYDQSNQPSLLDQYEYAMYGKIYKWKQEKPKEAVCVCRPESPARPPRDPTSPPPPRARRWRRRVPCRVPPPCSEVYVSFGGLLMRLRGDPRHLQKLQLDSRVYLLMRKI